MFRKLHGFTIMEVMMVLVIIGVLATLSIPRYQDFIGRAQVSDAVVLLNSSKVDIESHIAERGVFPENKTFISLNSIRHGYYTKSIDVAIADTCSAAGAIQATIKPTGTSSSIAGKTFVIERDAVGNWRCTRGWDNALSDTYLPASCRYAPGEPADPPDCPIFKNNNGHGNNTDGVDSSNPGKSNKDDSSGDVDDENQKGNSRKV